VTGAAPLREGKCLTNEQDVTPEDERQRHLVEWAATLSDRWCYFATLTFRHVQDPMSAVMKLRSWVAGFRGPRDYISRCLYCVEPHDSGAGHIHLLCETSHRPFIGHCKRCAHPDDDTCHRVQLTCVCKKDNHPKGLKTGEIYKRSAPHGASGSDPVWKHLNESWFCHFGLARFRPYDPALKFGAVAYVVKYLFKTDLMEWGYWDEDNRP